MAKEVGLSDAQRQLLQEAEILAGVMTEEELLAVVAGEISSEELDDDQLLVFLQAANLLYRAGEQLIDDGRYDFAFLAELKKRQPDHPFLGEVEPEPSLAMKTVELPVRMLSTEKAYDFETIERWGKRLEKGAEECGLDFGGLLFRATPKLDGFAAYDDGNQLYTRGDGRRGTDITRAFERGLQVAQGGRRGLGAGEIVVSRTYFAEHLADQFDNSRNFQASLIKEKELEPPAADAIASGAAVFFPFALLPGREVNWQYLTEHFEEIVDQLWHRLDYEVDGVIFEVTDERLKEHMGATRHHHRWQIAFKQNTAIAEVRVVSVIAQTSRSGRVNPVAEVEPTRLSGALIRRATAHHYKMVMDKGIGPGAVIRLSRSGEVIPKIEDVIEPVVPELPEACPSCGMPLIWESDYLFCVNSIQCPAQITNAIEHFFKTLGNIDGFGPSSIQKIFAAGVGSLPAIYRLTAAEFEAFGFGPKQAENMVAQLQRSRVEPIEDWRFLAAFGIFRMGMGNCEKLLEAHPLETVFDLTIDQITAIKGFSDKSASGIVTGLHEVKELFLELHGLGFNLIRTEMISADTAGTGVLAGKLVVFSGTMQSGSREDMKKRAKELGARIGDGVTGKTDLLVCGEKVGASKLTKAEKLGVKIVTEAEYLASIV